MASKLEVFTKLSDDDRAALASLSKNVRVVEARRDLICEGDKPRHAHLMLDGWACRYKTLPDGKRQIVSFFVPGDYCDVNAPAVRRMDHSIGAITRLKVAMIAPEDIETVVADRPRINEAFSWHDEVEVSTQREWTLNVGQRSAYERVAHLLVELYLRLWTVGRVNNGSCDFPLTQNDLAEATGLTAVHVNRTLQELRRNGLIELERRQLRTLDLDRLKDAAAFNANYLHLEHEGRHLDANA